MPIPLLGKLVANTLLDVAMKVGKHAVVRSGFQFNSGQRSSPQWLLNVLAYMVERRNHVIACLMQRLSDEARKDVYEEKTSTQIPTLSRSTPPGNAIPSGNLLGSFDSRDRTAVSPTKRNVGWMKASPE